MVAIGDVVVEIYVFHIIKQVRIIKGSDDYNDRSRPPFSIIIMYIDSLVTNILKIKVIK